MRILWLLLKKAPDEEWIPFAVFSSIRQMDTYLRRLDNFHVDDWDFEEIDLDPEPKRIYRSYRR